MIEDHTYCHWGGYRGKQLHTRTYKNYRFTCENQFNSHQHVGDINESEEKVANRQTLQKPKLITHTQITFQSQRPAPSMRAAEPRLPANITENVSMSNIYIYISIKFNKSCWKLVIHGNFFHLSVTAAGDLKVQCTTIALAQVPCPSHGLQLLQPLPDTSYL